MTCWSFGNKKKSIFDQEYERKQRTLEGKVMVEILKEMVSSAGTAVALYSATATFTRQDLVIKQIYPRTDTKEAIYQKCGSV